MYPAGAPAQPNRRPLGSVRAGGEPWRVPIAGSTRADETQSEPDEHACRVASDRSDLRDGGPVERAVDVRISRVAVVSPGHVELVQRDREDQVRTWLVPVQRVGNVDEIRDVVGEVDEPFPVE